MKKQARGHGEGETVTGGAESTEVRSDRKAGLVSWVHSLIAHPLLPRAVHADEKRNWTESGGEWPAFPTLRNMMRGYKARARQPQERLALSEGVQPAGPVLIDNSPEQ